MSFKDSKVESSLLKLIFEFLFVSIISMSSFLFSLAWWFYFSDELIASRRFLSILHAIVVGTETFLLGVCFSCSRGFSSSKGENIVYQGPNIDSRKCHTRLDRYTFDTTVLRPSFWVELKQYSVCLETLRV